MVSPAAVKLCCLARPVTDTPAIFSMHGGPVHSDGKKGARGCFSMWVKIAVVSYFIRTPTSLLESEQGGESYPQPAQGSGPRCPSSLPHTSQRVRANSSKCPVCSVIEVELALPLPNPWC